MLLGKHEIQKLNLIKGFDGSCLSDCSYYLRVGSILDVSTQKTLTHIMLKPGGQIVVFTQEEFCLPNNITSLATLRNGLSRQGILAINTGLIDSGYSGPVSSVITNFGKGDVSIAVGEQFLRVIFMRFKYVDRPKLVTISRERYTREREKESLERLGGSFFNADYFSKQACIKMLYDAGLSIVKFLGFVSILVALLVGIFQMADRLCSQDGVAKDPNQDPSVEHDQLATDDNSTNGQNGSKK